MHERKRYLTTSFDTDKASVGFSIDEFEIVKNAVEKIYYNIQLGESSVSEYQEPFVYNLRKDLEQIDEQGPPYEIWMDYHILEEVYHLIGRCDAGVQAEFQDAMREFEHLETDP